MKARRGEGFGAGYNVLPAWKKRVDARDIDDRRQTPT